MKRIFGFSDSFFEKELQKKDLKQKYSGTVLGLVWMFVNPLIMVILYWFVFQNIFKMGSIDGIPYILWLLAGIIPWFYYLELIGSGTMVLIDYKYLISKVKFDLNSIYKIKLRNSLYVHIFMLILLVIIDVFYGRFSLYAIQLLYYFMCLIFLMYNLIKLTSTLNVFFKDTIQIINVLNILLFWLTPVFWSISMAKDYAFIIMLNPLAYIVEGYRNSFVYHKWFFEDMTATIIFWVVSILIFLLSKFIYNRLNKHFADVL